MSAAVCAVLAISPPVGRAAGSVHRLESLGDPTAGRPWLLRALVTADSDASPALGLTSPDAPVELIGTVRGHGTWFRLMVPPRAGEVRLRAADAAGVRVVRSAVRPLRLPGAIPSLDERVMVVEGTLVPEVVGEVIVRPTGSPVGLLPVTDQVLVEPAQRSVDACGLASFNVRVAGLGAPVALVAQTAGGEHRDELRLPLVPGGLAVRDDVDSVLLRATSPGPIAYLTVGDGSGPTWWTAAPLAPDSDEGSVRVGLLSGTLWVAASRNGDLSEPTSPLIRPSSPACLATPAGRRLARGRLSPPPLPPLRILWDGPAADRTVTQIAIHRARVLCVLGLGVSVGLEALLLLGAGLAHGPSALRFLAGDRRERLGLLVAGISTLLLMGAAMALAVGLRTP